MKSYPREVMSCTCLFFQLSFSNLLQPIFLLSQVLVTMSVTILTSNMISSNVPSIIPCHLDQLLLSPNTSFLLFLCHRSATSHHLFFPFFSPSPHSISQHLTASHIITPPFSFFSLLLIIISMKSSSPAFITITITIQPSLLAIRIILTIIIAIIASQSLLSSLISPFSLYHHHHHHQP